jgi:signal transduction histidine kinase
METSPIPSLHVLIIENSQIDRKVLGSMLDTVTYGTFHTDTADSLIRACEKLSQGGYDVCILDLNLKDSKGLNTLSTLHQRFPDLPIVVNTGSYEDTLGVQAVAKGAQDYLVKGKYKPHTLSKSLCYAVERKKIELELKKAYHTLKETQTQLIQAEKLKVVGGMASGVAHEVKNPLTAILYGIEYLKQHCKGRDEKIDLTITSIEEAARAANRIIQDLLDFANLSRLERRLHNLNVIVEQALNMTRHQCDKYQIRIRTYLDPSLPMVTADHNRIQQVIVNLILNAVHAMQKTGGELTLYTRSKPFQKEDFGWMDRRGPTIEEGKIVVVLDIQDTGPGIPQEQLDKIFDPFFTTRRATGGVGLGLSIARTIIQNHQGLIRLENLPEKGARSRIILPLPD